MHFISLISAVLISIAIAMAFPSPNDNILTLNSPLMTRQNVRPFSPASLPISTTH